MALIAEYFRLTEQYAKEYGKNTVVLMQVGKFFECYGRVSPDSCECHGSEMDNVSSICELAKADKIPGAVKMIGFPEYMLDKNVKKLDAAGYTSVVYVQDAAMQNTTRSLMAIYSPGTYFSSETNELSNNTTCIWIEVLTVVTNRVRQQQIMFGMANIDIYTGRLTVFQHANPWFHNPTTYDEVERFLASFNPSELIFITNLSPRTLDEVVQFTGASTAKIMHRIHYSADSTASAATMSPHLFSQSSDSIPEVRLSKVNKCTKQIYQHEVLKTFFPDIDVRNTLFYQLDFATQACVYLLNFVHEHNPGLVSKIHEPVFDNCSDRLILANNSLKQLNIIDDNVYVGKHSSVMRFLNNCVTPMGQRKFKYRILHPTFNEESMEQEYLITGYLLNSTSSSSSPDIVLNWREQLTTIRDIERYQRQIMLKKITPQSLFTMHQNMRTIAHLYDSISKDQTISSYLGRFVKGNIGEKSSEFANHIDNHLVLDVCKGLNDTEFTANTNVIKPGVSPELDKTLFAYETTMNELSCIHKYLNEMIRSSGERVPARRKNVKVVPNEDDSENEDGATTTSTTEEYHFVKLHETDKLGFSLQVTKKRAKTIEEMIKAMRHKNVTEVALKDCTFHLSDITFPAASSGNHTIHTPQLNKLFSMILSLRNSVCSLIAQTFFQFIVSLQQQTIDDIIEYVSLIDNLQNQCYIARKNNYCRPTISGEATKSFVSATNLRHCLIEKLNEDETYVGNDISLGTRDLDGILLYGTNAVGKTSLIRALGIAVIMAQAGLYVPCSQFTFKPYKTLFTRIIGNDNLFKGMSTFMVEMSELRVILNMATENSLILGDELCSGTEIDSAISIFVSGLHWLHRANSSFIFATHLHEITSYHEIREMKRIAMKHMTVTYNKEMDALIYDRKLQDGPGHSMYGLEVCKSLNLPMEFLEYANDVRIKHRAGPSTGSILGGAVVAKAYNASKVRRMCEICNVNEASEIHHLKPQCDADNNNYIGHVPKNHVANLASICENCHQSIHKEQSVEHVRMKTTKGFKIVSKKNVTEV